MIKIYHNPRCRKSREGLELLEKSGKEFEVVLYLDEVPSKEELGALIQKLGIPPMELVRKNEPAWKENFKNKDLTDAEIIEAMVSFPKLIERPIIINGDAAVVGRPSEKITAII